MGEWRAIGSIFDFEKGTLQSSKNIPGAYTFITAAEEWKTHATYTHDCEALIFAMAASGSLGRTHYFNGKFIASDLCFILRPKAGLKIDLKFYHRLFNFLREDIVKKTATGTSKLAINKTNFSNYKIPYFEYEHQQKFKELIEKIYQNLTSVKSELDHQQTLLTRLRQAILQEAVEGKLTAEWRRQHPELISGEHHAARLLEKIKAEKEKLAKNTKGTKKTKELPPVSDEEKPFDLPEGWVWCRLGDLADNIHYGYTASANYNINVPKFIRITDIQDNKVVWEKVPGCKISKSNILKYELNPRDILIARTGGTIGKTFLVKTLPYKSVFASYLIRLIPNDLICVEYLKNFMESPLYWLQLHKMSWGGGQPNVNATNLNKMLFPLPNFTEQHAIVEKVDRLLAMVDKLAQQVQERKTHAEQLMQAVLREAFEGDTSVNKVEYKSVESK
jgi:type I restriction enzyme S subunit